MTRPHYPQGCAAGSKDRGETVDPENSDNAFAVNCNNGNANWNNRNNVGVVRAVRSLAPSPGEYQSACGVSFAELFRAWKEARAGKQPSRNQLRFDTRWPDALMDLQERVNDGAWSPGPSLCFIAEAPKAREIHAPDFGDRVLHHWLVPQLEAIYEPRFIFDSYANRKGRGTHKAVERLQSFVRQVQSGQGGGWYLQLDIHNFFNSIHRPTLYAMLKREMERHDLPLHTRQAAHALLRRPPLDKRVTYRCTAEQRALVPAHKRLENAGPGRGLPVGNLSSQFLANVYLDALDQFCKHALKARRYLRYVDDFVLVHHDRALLEIWLKQIEAFLHERLQLRLKPEIKLRPLTAGIDFLGYVIYPHHTLARRRVVVHCRSKLADFERRHVGQGQIVATPEQLRAVVSQWHSYQGHFAHARAWSLQGQFRRRFRWLSAIETKRRFALRMEGRPVKIGFAGERARQ